MKLITAGQSQHRGWRIAAALCTAVTFACLFSVTACAEKESELKVLIEQHYVEMLALFPTVILLLFLAFIVQIDHYIRSDLKRTMQIIIAAVFSLVVQNYAEYRLVEEGTQWLARTLISIYGYAIRPVILVLFLYMIAPRKRNTWVWVMVGLNTLVNATALFSHICFWIDETNHYQSGPLHNMCLYVSAILMVYWLFLTARVFRLQQRKETWVPLLLLALIIVAVILDSSVGLVPQPVSFLTISAVIGCVANYIWLHLQFVREHEQALQAEQRMKIMMTQIQPHFLYNTIATIRALCRRDAVKAGNVAEKFGEYLRQNLDSLGIVGLIPFQRELEHTRIYAEIEMVRFENIRVEYDIQDDRFFLPPLTLQPLVENAIRHGVRIREEGLVRVSAWRGENGYEIVVWDNGTGFDVSAIATMSASHIGIRNVRERIERMCGGVLQVESRIGEGTTVTIVIPLQNDPNEVRV